MSEFLVEAYVSQASAAGAASAADVSLAAEELTRAGTPVRLVSTILVAEEEICFYLYEAQSISVVREAATLAGLRVERVSEAVLDDNGSSPSSSKEERQ